MRLLHEDLTVSTTGWAADPPRPPSSLFLPPLHVSSHTPPLPSSFYSQFWLIYPLSTLHTLIKVIYLIPLLPPQPSCSTCPTPRLTPTSSPSFSTRFLSGRSLPGVIHLSLLTWPLTGLLEQQAWLVRIAVVEGAVGGSNKLCFLSWRHTWEQRGPEGFSA